MASAWGNSWGNAWGNAWGARDQQAEAPGGSGARPQRDPYFAINDDRDLIDIAAILLLSGVLDG